jgi:hypothetical protein
MDLYNVFNQGRGGAAWQNLPNGQQRQYQINPQQFIQVAQTLDQNSLSRLVNMARAQGIPDTEIQAGLNFINSLR